VEKSAKKSKKSMNISNNGNQQQGSESQQQQQPQQFFTAEEVKRILDRALKVQEDHLREQYDKVLTERLHEQFNRFAKFNEDLISRQMKDSDFSSHYMS